MPGIKASCPSGMCAPTGWKLSLRHAGCSAGIVLERMHRSEVGLEFFVNTATILLRAAGEHSAGLKAWDAGRQLNVARRHREIRAAQK